MQISIIHVLRFYYSDTHTDTLTPIDCDFLGVGLADESIQLIAINSKSRLYLLTWIILIIYFFLLKLHIA